jgi:hypothetical protein
MDSRAETLAEDKEMGRSVSPSPPTSINKETKANLDDLPTDNEDGSVRDVTPAEGVEGEGEYPEGFRMAAIVIALLLSIFLVCSPIYSDFRPNLTYSGISRYDYRCHSYSQNH